MRDANHRKGIHGGSLGGRWVELYAIEKKGKDISPDLHAKGIGPPPSDIASQMCPAREGKRSIDEGHQEKGGRALDQTGISSKKLHGRNPVIKGKKKEVIRGVRSYYGLGRDVPKADGRIGMLSPVKGGMGGFRRKTNGVRVGITKSAARPPGKDAVPSAGKEIKAVLFPRPAKAAQVAGEIEKRELITRIAADVHRDQGKEEHGFIRRGRVQSRKKRNLP